jgi:hypothetical protein
LEAFYPWFVLAHLVGLVLFAMAHGASAFMAFRVRRERDPVVVESLLGIGQLSIGPMYIGLLLLGVGGLGAAAGANLWGQPWIIASIAIFVVVLIVMWAVASPYYMGLRKALQERGPDGRPAIEPGDPGIGWNHRVGAARLADGHQARLRPAIADVHPPGRASCVIEPCSSSG